jgi:hypothetical protein
MPDRLNLTVTGELQRRIEEEAKERGISKGEYVRRAVQAALLADERLEEERRRAGEGSTTRFGVWTEDENGHVTRALEITGI